MIEWTKRGPWPRPATKRVCRKMFTIDQAADFAGVSTDKIRYWLITRKLEGYDLGGFRIRIDEEELTELLMSLESEHP